MIQRSKIADDLVTVEQFYQLVSDGQKADLIDGVIYMASPNSRRNSSLTTFISSLLNSFVSAKDIGGEVFVERFAFKLSEISAPEPDVAYVGPDRLHLLSDAGMHGGPDIAVEIVSRDSRARDYGEKRQLYLEAGVAEYWIVDPLQSRVEFLRLTDGAYELVPLEQNSIFRSQALPGFWLDVNWLLANPRPNMHQCLQEILKV